MPAVAGIKFIKDAKKNNRYVTIDLKKHSATVMPLLKQLGAVKEDEDDFEKEWKKGITGEEFLKRMHHHMDDIFSKKKIK
jgi:hypothetical protein